MSRFDVVVIGSGHNGMVAAARLLDAGSSVLVLEQAETAGGMTGVQAAFPGSGAEVMVTRGATDLTLLRRDAAALIGLSGADSEGASGETLAEFAGPVVAFAPEDSVGAALTLHADVSKTAAAIAEHHQGDAARWPDFVHWLSERMAELEPLLRAGQGEKSPASRFEAMARLARTPELLRAASLPLTTLLGEWFESERVQSMLAVRALLGVRTGPGEPGSGYPFLYRSFGTTASGLAPVRRPAGGMAAFADAMVRSIEQRGGHVALGSRVERIVLDGGRVRGVEVARPTSSDPDGREFIATGCVLATCDPFVTFERLVGSQHLPIETGRRMRAARPKGSVARLDLLLGAPPRFRGQTDAAELTGTVVLGSNLAQLDEAAIAARRGQPSLTLDGTVSVERVASRGQRHRFMVSFVAQHVPIEGRVDAGDLLSRMLARLDAAAPGIVDLIEQRRLHLPGEWEAEWGVAGGHIDHGETTLERSFILRPWRNADHWSTPVGGLFLCGAGVHPGGGVTGLPGLGAARAVLRSIDRPQPGDE